MANSNFVVHNGLTVGPLTINASTGDISTTGNISAGNIITTTANILLVQDSLIYLNNTNVYPYTYSIGMYGHYIGGPANAYVHTAVTRQNNDGAWWFVSNISEPSPATANIDVTTNAIYDTIRCGNIIPGASNVYTLGSLTNWWSKAFTVAATAQYADLAENYVGDAGYAAGTVVDFGGTHEVTVCDSDMSPRVAGVVSTNPAYLMNGTQTGEHIVPVALTGRVPTKVRGPIRKGDLIVSAGDGHARAETLPQVGTVIGKALEDFDGDSGVIEVVVGKH